MNYQMLPALSAQEYQALKADIAARGLMVPIEKDEHGNTLDGFHREQICQELGLTDYPVTIRAGLNEDEKIHHAIALNLERRHLNTEQRRELVVNLRTKHGWSNRMIAGVIGVSDVTVMRDLNSTATNVAVELPDTIIGKDGKERPAHKPKTITASTPQQAEAALKCLQFSGWNEGDTSTTTAVEVIQEANKTLYESNDNRNEPTATGEQEILAAASKIRAQRTEERRSERLANLEQIATGNSELNGELGTFPVVYADPPWKYEHAESESRAIENQYPTMELDAICALPLGEVTTPDAVLFLWATSPKLAEAMRVVEDWGFVYRTCMIWDKEKMGMGYYARQQHELLLIATKGQPPAPAPNARPRSVIRIERGEHSAKPHEFYELIEAMYPTLPKLEMFCRAPRDGWRAWGNQC